MRNVLFAGICVVAALTFVSAVRGGEPTLAPTPAVERSVLVQPAQPAASPVCTACKDCTCASATAVRERQPRIVRTVTRSNATACGENSTTHTVARYRLFGRTQRACNCN